MLLLADLEIGDDLTFYVQAVDTGGSASDAFPDVVDYRIYREEVAAAVAVGVMAHLDAQVGMYAETVTLANPPYPAGQYVIRITATVDGETPATLLYFRILDPSLADEVAETVWKRQQPAVTDPGAMEDIKTDTDAMEFQSREG